MKTKSREAGQSILLIVLALGLFLLGAVAFAVDMGNLWWHRQQAQRAADAACLAGAMDALGRKPDWVDFVETYIFNAPKAFAVFNPPVARAAE